MKYILIDMEKIIYNSSVFVSLELYYIFVIHYYIFCKEKYGFNNL